VCLICRVYYSMVYGILINYCYMHLMMQHARHGRPAALHPFAVRVVMTISDHSILLRLWHTRLSCADKEPFEKPPSPL
jgi:hypothetical protein